MVSCVFFHFFPLHLMWINKMFWDKTKGFIKCQKLLSHLLLKKSLISALGQSSHFSSGCTRRKRKWKTQPTNDGYHYWQHLIHRKIQTTEELVIWRFLVNYHSYEIFIHFDKNMKGSYAIWLATTPRPGLKDTVFLCHQFYSQWTFASLLDRWLIYQSLQQ